MVGPGHREPRSIRDLFSLHVKICEAKELVPWGLLLSKKKKEEDMLRIVVPPYISA